MSFIVLGFCLASLQRMLSNMSSKTNIKGCGRHMVTLMRTRERIGLISFGLDTIICILNYYMYAFVIGLSLENATFLVEMKRTPAIGPAVVYK